jgi:hypothetical protein
LKPLWALGSGRTLYGPIPSQDPFFPKKYQKIWKINNAITSKYSEGALIGLKAPNISGTFVWFDRKSGCAESNQQQTEPDFEVAKKNFAKKTPAC